MSEQNEYSMFLDKVSKNVPKEYAKDQKIIIDRLTEIYGIEVTDNMQEELALISRTTIKEDMNTEELTNYLQNFERVANGIFKAKTSKKITNPDMTVEEIREILKISSDQCETDGRTGLYSNSIQNNDTLLAKGKKIQKSLLDSKTKQKTKTMPEWEKFND